MSTVFLTLEQVLVIHQTQINNFGGSHGIRDLSLLESALFRPQTTFGDRELYPTVFEKAAAIVHSLVLNHPFIDGNKRTATLAMIIFLKRNGVTIKIGKEDLVTYILSIESKKVNIDDIAEWLRQLNVFA